MAGHDGVCQVASAFLVEIECRMLEAETDVEPSNLAWEGLTASREEAVALPTLGEIGFSE